MKTLLLALLVLSSPLAAVAQETTFSPALHGHYFPATGGNAREGFVTRIRPAEGQAWMNLKDGGSGWVPMNRLDGRLQVRLGVASEELRAQVAKDDAARAAFMAEAMKAQAEAADRRAAAAETKAVTEAAQRQAAAAEKIAEEMRYRNWLEQDRQERLRAIRGY